MDRDERIALYTARAADEKDLFAGIPYERMHDCGLTRLEANRLNLDPQFLPGWKDDDPSISAIAALEDFATCH